MSRMKNGKVFGSIANITWYTFKGIDILRSKPGRGVIKQTEATNKNSSHFGKAAKMDSKLLNGLANELNFRMPPANRDKTSSNLSVRCKYQNI